MQGFKHSIYKAFNSARILNPNQKMERRNSSSHEKYSDVGYEPSSSSSFSSSSAYCRTASEASAFSDDHDLASPRTWPQGLKSPARAALSRLGMRQHKHAGLDDEAMDLGFLKNVKERFSKLLLGEDMSGSGKGVCTAVTISNAITNLYASVFGQQQRLEPLHPEKKVMWKREMNCLLSVCDYILEFSPSFQTLKDGTTLEVMASRPRSDIHINLPALKKLDLMLLDILNSFQETEFWYAEQGTIPASSNRSVSFRKVVQPQPQRQDEKWWLPVPCIVHGGLSEKSKRHLRQNHDRANQIHKAAMAINTGILSEMQIPDSYMASLPKSGKAIVGDAIYRYMCNAGKFSPDHLLDSLSISSEHEALEVADKVEAAMQTWRRKTCMAQSKSSWEVERSEKNHGLAGRAETVLLCLKQRYPELSQTTLDTSKIEYNKDVGQAVMESYSRVLEGLAFNIVAWIDDVVYADEAMKSRVQAAGDGGMQQRNLGHLFVLSSSI